MTAAKTTVTKSESSSVLCAPPSDLINTKEEPDAVLSINLVVPMTLVCGMIYLTYIMAQDMHDKLLQNKGASNPIKGVWLVGPLFFSAFYLQVIYFGKKYMAEQKPLKIKPFVFTYNLYQCLLNLWTVIEMIREVRSNNHFTSAWGNSAQPDNIKGFRISLLVWMHYNNKFVELLDTLWMILKKKDKQISFLHCYHHILLIWVWFICCRIEPGGDSYFGACVNSFIHVLMYGYYTMSLLQIPCPWKKWITNCQMLQFAVCLTHASYVFYKGNMPWELSAAQAFVMVNMLVLFGHFYIKTYLSGDKTKGDASAVKKRK